MNAIKKYSLCMGAVLLMLSACSRAQDSSPQKTDLLKDKKLLIVYLSRTKNTKAVAGMIHQQTGGKLVELELQTPYPENYQQIVAQVAKENETGFLPPLKTKVDSMKQYDIVFIGFPTWGMQLPPPIKSFIAEYDLSGKTVIPFNTNAGYGIGSSFDKVKELASASKMLEGFTIKGGTERDGVLFVMEGDKKVDAEKKVREWLNKIGVTK